VGASGCSLLGTQRCVLFYHTLRCVRDVTVLIKAEPSSDLLVGVCRETLNNERFYLYIFYICTSRVPGGRLAVVLLDAEQLNSIFTLFNEFNSLSEGLEDFFFVSKEHKYY